MEDQLTTAPLNEPPLGHIDSNFGFLYHPPAALPCNNPGSVGRTHKTSNTLHAHMKTRLLPLLALFLSACATLSKPVPEGYTGPVVQLADTGQQEDGTKGRFFCAVEVNGREIQNCLRETRSASYGHGFALSSRYTTREVPVTEMKVKLVGTHQTAAPIHEIASRMAGTFFSVDGVVDFKPTEGHSYIVTGELKKERSCVWIAEANSNEPETEKACTGPATQ